MRIGKADIYPAYGEISEKGVQITSQQIFALMLAVILVFTLLRCIHLGADTPEGISNNVGIYVDEGYKTLDPRNMILFGKRNWHPADDYRGWIKASPLTNWPYYLSFKLFGVHIHAAKIVTIGYFFLFLMGYLITMGRRYQKALLVCGLTALSIQGTFFFFSRVALIEVPIAAAVYGCLFLLLKLESHPVPLSIAVLIGAILVGFFGIKTSAILYFLPVCLAFTVVLVFGANFSIPRWTVWLCVLGFIAMFLILAVSTQYIWQDRVGASGVGIWRRTLVTPLAEAAPFTVVLGLFCASQALLTYPKAVFGSIYRCSLLALITVCPITLALFPYNPTRYYVPVIPAYILLALEWFHLRATQEADETIQWQWLTNTLAFVLLFFCVFSVGVMINKLILRHLPFYFGDEPGLSGPTMARYFPPIAAAGAAIIYMLRRYPLSASVFTKAVLVLAGIAIAYNGFLIGKFSVKPSYQALNVQRQIAGVVPADGSIAGDWAPFLTMNTSLRSIYLNTYQNRENILAIRPTFFLHNDNRISEGNMEEIIRAPGASLGQPILRSEYHQAKIILYPIIYSH